MEQNKEAEASSKVEYIEYNVIAYSVEFREAVAYSLWCLNERNQTSRICHLEIRPVYGMVSKRKLRLPQVFL